MQDLLTSINVKIEKIEATLSEVLSLLKANHSEVKKEQEDHVINGVNLKRVYSRDAYSYGLQLLDILFTKEEQSSSLLFTSKRSPKQALEKSKVKKLLSLVKEKYKDGWDMKIFICKNKPKM